MQVERSTVILAPRLSSILCSEDNETIIHGIAKQHSFAVPCIEPKSIVEASRILVLIQEFPGVAAVGGFVEAGLVAGTAGHDDGGVGVEGLDAAEVEFFGVGRDGAGL